MSQENLEFARRAYEALNSRDFSRTGEFLDPEIEIDVSRNVINPGVYHGHAGFEQMVRATDDVWDDFHIEPGELFDVGDHVVVAVTISGSGKGSGVLAEMDLFNVLTVRGEKIVRIVGGLRSKAEALATAGVSE